MVEVGLQRLPTAPCAKCPSHRRPHAPPAEGLVAWTQSEADHQRPPRRAGVPADSTRWTARFATAVASAPRRTTAVYGPPISRYIEIKRHLPKAFPLSKYVMLDHGRCIQCGRCVRFTEEISGDAQLASFFRGAQTQPHTFQLTEFTSRFSGNGSKSARWKADQAVPPASAPDRGTSMRQKALCTMCSNGCNLYFDSRAGRWCGLMPARTPKWNEVWT